MARRKHAVTSSPAWVGLDRSHIVEDTTRAGEIVGIRGERGAYKVICEALNVDTETGWMELWSPDKEFRAVRPERIVKRRARSGRRP